MLRVYLIGFIFIFQNLLYGQVTIHSASINFLLPNDSDTVIMNGLLDGNNTLTYPNYKAFEPMQSLKITNNANTTVHSPRIIINKKRNWYDISSMTAECFNGAVTDKEKALFLWNFVRNGRIHRFESEYGAEMSDPIKFMGVYGYGMCYNTNYSNTFIAQGVPAISRSYSPRGRHFISEVDFGSGYMFIDSDLETFYLKSDNTSLASYEDIYTDKNLIKRAHHYGKHSPYSNEMNEILAYKLYGVRSSPYYFGHYYDFHTLDCSLRPNESIVYSWEPGRLYHSFENVNNADSTDIANGKLIYATNFLNAGLNELVDTVLNLTTYSLDSQKPNLHSSGTDTNACFVMKITSPFVILNGTVAGVFFQQTVNDKVKISFSKDSVTWDLVWGSSQTGYFSDSVELYNMIQTLYSPAIYYYYLKFEFTSESDSIACGIDSLSVISDFQVSRSFLPELCLGNNIIDYSDTDTAGRNVDVSIIWKESTDNIPPTQIQSPVFPLDSSQVDSLRFTFHWNDANDTDGIIDYEFQLSDRLDMKYPLMPSFEIYTSKTNNGAGLDYFSIPLDGMLNSGTTYYWRVKAKDSQGVWGAWSPVWSFVPVGPMPPVNGEAEVVSDTSLVIKWNSSTVGNPPTYYEIHSSDEWLGFSISPTTLFDTVSSDSILIPLTCFTPETFYRIVAVDSNGSKSGVSEVIQIPYPYVYTCPDTIMPFEAYNYVITTNDLYAKDIDIINMYYQNVIINDTIEMQVLSKPDWLSVNGNTLIGTPDYQDVFPDGLDDTTFSVEVMFTGKYSGIQSLQTLKLPSKPPGGTTKIPGNLNELKVNVLNVYPNPFKNTMSISYNVNSKSLVKLTIFNIYGQKIEELINEMQDKGEYNAEWNSTANPAGIYFLVFEVSDVSGAVQTFTKRIVKVD